MITRPASILVLIEHGRAGVALISEPRPDKSEAPLGERESFVRVAGVAAWVFVEFGSAWSFSFASLHIRRD